MAADVVTMRLLGLQGFQHRRHRSRTHIDPQRAAELVDRPVVGARRNIDGLAGQRDPRFANHAVGKRRGVVAVILRVAMGRKPWSRVQRARTPCAFGMEEQPEIAARRLVEVGAMGIVATDEQLHQSDRGKVWQLGQGREIHLRNEFQRSPIVTAWPVRPDRKPDRPAKARSGSLNRSGSIRAKQYGRPGQRRQRASQRLQLHGVRLDNGWLACPPRLHLRLHLPSSSLHFPPAPEHPEPEQQRDRCCDEKPGHRVTSSRAAGRHEPFPAEVTHRSCGALRCARHRPAQAAR